MSDPQPVEPGFTDAPDVPPTPLAGALIWPADGPLADQPAATDLLLKSLLEAAVDVRRHEHPSHGDMYCLNLTCFMGDRMGAVLKRVSELQAEVARLRQRNVALADHAAALIEEAQA